VKSRGHSGRHCHDGLVQSVTAVIEDHFDRWGGNGTGVIVVTFSAPTNPNSSRQSSRPSASENWALSPYAACSTRPPLGACSVFSLNPATLSSSRPIGRGGASRSSVPCRKRSGGRGGAVCPVLPQSRHLQGSARHVRILPLQRLWTLTRECVQVVLRRLEGFRQRDSHWLRLQWRHAHLQPSQASATIVTASATISDGQGTDDVSGSDAQVLAFTPRRTGRTTVGAAGLEPTTSAV